jgi:hypothetical protein
MRVVSLVRRKSFEMGTVYFSSSLKSAARKFPQCSFKSSVSIKASPAKNVRRIDGSGDRRNGMREVLALTGHPAGVKHTTIYPDNSYGFFDTIHVRDPAIVGF